PRRRSLHFAQFRHERRYLREGERRLMPHASLLRAQRQQMPDDRLVGRVVAVAAASRTGEVEHCLDPPTYAARRYRLVGNQQFEGLEHKPAVDRRNGKVAEHWIGIASKRGQPLLAVLCVAPFARVYGEVVLGTLPERHLLGLLGPGGEHGAVAGLDRVETAGQLLMAIVPQLSRQCERDRPSAAQAHVALAAMTLILEDPALAAVGNLQVEVAAIGVAALTTDASYEGGGKLVPGAHRLLLALSRFKTTNPEDARGGVRATQGN